MLKFTEAAPTDRFAWEEVDRSGLMPQPALAIYFLEILPNTWMISSFYLHLERDSVFLVMDRSEHH